MFKIVLSHALCSEGMSFLKAQKDVETVVANTGKSEDILPYLRDADAFILRIGCMTALMIDQCSKLKVIARPGVGVDTIDVKYATSKGIPVVVTPGANSRSVAEHTILGMLALAKNLQESVLEAKKGNYDIRNKYVAFELYGKTLGILGFGNIGRIVAKMASAMGMNIAVHDPFIPVDEIKRERYTYYDTVEKILPVCDVVTLHMASNDQTRGMFDKRLFDLMKEGALLVNNARGDLVNEVDLYDALISGHLAGAQEDMMVQEPFDLSSPLLTLNNFIVTPHMASLTKESSVRCALMCIEGTLAILRGSKWPKVFDCSVYEHEIWKKTVNKNRENVMLMRLDPADNVAVVLKDTKAGEALICDNNKIKLVSDIPFGHKCALKDIAKGEKIYKYGCPIGYSIGDIKTGELVREHNMKGLRGRGDLEGKER